MTEKYESTIEGVDFTNDRTKKDGYYFFIDLHKHGDITSIVYIKRLSREVFRMGNAIGESFDPYRMMRSVEPIKLPIALDEGW